MKTRLSDGREIELDKDAVFRHPPAASREWLAEFKQRKERQMEPTIETCDSGVTAIFKDGAKVFLSIQGRFPCSLCGERLCPHFHAALPHFARWKWETAQGPDCSWGPTLLQRIGIVPWAVRPDLIGKQNRWAPCTQGEEVAPGVRVWHANKGLLVRFSDDGSEGHVYVGDDHPDGHTPCLICRDGCDHVERALAVAEEVNGGGK